MAYKIDLTGHKYGKLTVIEFAGNGHRRESLWKCQCDCGNTRIVTGSHLRTGHTSSCGCKSKDRIGTLNYKTGLSNTRLYGVYRNMLNRCYWNKAKHFCDYGGRGITVCDEWLGDKGFENFLEWSRLNGYTDKLTIDRIDNNSGYSPDNCRWVDRYVQANNKRNTHYIRINGEVGTVANMARKYNISYWNVLHYSKGGMNCKYPELKIEAVI